jgi:hypothetical protein
MPKGSESLYFHALRLVEFENLVCKNSLCLRLFICLLVVLDF